MPSGKCSCFILKAPEGSFDGRLLSQCVTWSDFSFVKIALRTGKGIVWRDLYLSTEERKLGYSILDNEILVALDSKHQS